MRPKLFHALDDW